MVLGWVVRAEFGRRVARAPPDHPSQAAPFFDKLIFSKISARLGGSVKAVVSGGAPLAPHVEEFLRVTMCAPVSNHHPPTVPACTGTNGLRGDG